MYNIIPLLGQKRNIYVDLLKNSRRVYFNLLMVINYKGLDYERFLF